MTTNMTTASIEQAAIPTAIGRGRMLWGVSLLALTILLVVGVRAFWLWTETELGPNDVLYFHGWSQGPLLFLGVLISGPATAAALLLLVPPVVSHVHHAGYRTMLKAIAGTLSVAASLAWIYFLLFFGLFAVLSSYHHLSSELGESILLQRHFDPESYSVWSQESTFVYAPVDSVAVHSSAEYIDPNECILDSQNGVFSLACGEETVSFSMGR